jgi:hypothetical protein
MLYFYWSRFFLWESDQHKRKYQLTKWNIIYRPKDQGGLEIEILDINNRWYLPIKSLFKIHNEERVWQKLLHNKYLKNKTLSQVIAKPVDSQFWKGLVRVKNDLFDRGSFIIGNG